MTKKCVNLKQKPDGTPDKEGSIASLEPLKADDPEMHAKVLKIFMTCGQKSNKRMNCLIH